MRTGNTVITTRNATVDRPVLSSQASGAYDSLASIRLMDGVVDIYMPDFKW